MTNLNSGLAATARTPAIAMVFGLNVGAFGAPATTFPIIVGALRVRVKYSFRQRAALKDDPVLNLNTLVGFDTQENGELRSVRIPMDQVPKSVRTLDPSDQSTSGTDA